MGISIKSKQVETLINEVAALAGESKTEAVFKAMLDRKAALQLNISPADKAKSLLRFLESAIWSSIPKRELGKQLSKKEWEAILGL